MNNTSRIVAASMCLFVVCGCAAESRGGEDGAGGNAGSEAVATCSLDMIDYMESGVTEEDNGFWQSVTEGAGVVSDLSPDLLYIRSDDGSNYVFQWRGEDLLDDSNWASPWAAGLAVQFSRQGGLDTVSTASTTLFALSMDHDASVEAGGVDLVLSRNCRYTTSCVSGSQEVVVFDMSVGDGGEPVPPGGSRSNLAAELGQVQNLIAWDRSGGSGCDWRSGFIWLATLSASSP